MICENVVSILILSNFAAIIGGSVVGWYIRKFYEEFK